MGAKIVNTQLYKQAGVDPKTKKPDREKDDPLKLKEGFKKVFRIIDEQDAVNRYKWFNLPMDLSSEELERLLYYKGQLCFFYYKELEKFFILPYALEGTIDFYGRYNHVHPVPMATGTDDTKEAKAQYQKTVNLLTTLKLKVIKEPILPEDLTLEDYLEGCVLLHDYTKQLSQTIIPRQALNDCFIEVASDILPYLNTALLAGTGIKGMRVNDADSKDEADKASKQVKYSALSGKLYNAMISAVDFQDLADGSPLKTEEFLLALQGIDNMRKGALGIENGGIFQKKAHKLESEQAGNESSVATVFQDGLSIRQRFCIICNSIWGTEMWCEPAESMVQVDLNGDGVTYDRDGASPAPVAEQEQTEGGTDNE